MIEVMPINIKTKGNKTREFNKAKLEAQRMSYEQRQLRENYFNYTF